MDAGREEPDQPSRPGDCAAWRSSCAHGATRRREPASTRDRARHRGYRSRCSRWTRLAQSAQLPPLGVYVHLPWCIRKCPYCDFNSHEAPARRHSGRARYLDALEADLDAACRWSGGGRCRPSSSAAARPACLARGHRPLLLPARAGCRSDARCEVTHGSQSRDLRARALRGYRVPASIGCRSACRASTTRDSRPSAGSTMRPRRGRRRGGAARSSDTSTST